MRGLNLSGLNLVVGTLFCASAEPASARTYVAAATGYASDQSNPRDGIGDIAGPTGNLIDMVLNGTDADPQAITDRRGVFEIDGATITDHLTSGAFLQFDVFGSISADPINIFLYAGDGLVTSEDYGRTDHLAFSAVLANDTPFINVTTQVQEILAGGDTWIGVLVAMTHEDQTLSIDDVDGHGIDPSITTKGVPEPVTLTLLGALSLAAFGRRRAF